MALKSMRNKRKKHYGVVSSGLGKSRKARAAAQKKTLGIGTLYTGKPNKKYNADQGK